MDTVPQYSLGEVQQLLVEEARNLEKFLSGLLSGAEDKEAIRAQLLSGAEPEFTRRYENVCQAQHMIWKLAGDSSPAFQIALEKIKILPKDPNLEGLCKYLRSVAGLG